MSQQAALQPGLSIGKYEVVKHLATGGMAEIYLARVNTLPGLQKLVVLKRMLPELAARDDFVQMFLDEARIATLLDHPNVVHTFDAGVVEGKPFLAMEYLHGDSVNRLMPALAERGERLPIEHALAIVTGVCAGLHYTHEKVDLDGRALNIVHRDVTPQNVIVTYDGGVKLVDFGIAKSDQREGRTRYGTIKGKAPYMSPEQCLGEPLDRRSDVFSVGIMLYELTLGRRLFVGKGDYEVLKQIVEGWIVPPHQLDPSYAPALEAVVMRALEKNPAKRQATARELQGELEAVARAAQLPISSLALAQLMERCFGSRIQVLREAEAQGNVELLSLVLEQGIASEELDELPGSAPAVLLDAPTRIDRHPPAAPARPRGGRSKLLAAALALVGVAALVLVARNAGEPTTPRAAPATPAPAPSTTPVPVETREPPKAVETTRAPKPRPPSRPTASHPPPRAPVPSAPAAPAARASGSGLLILASSPWCRVTVDGTDRGPTPLHLELPAGPHVVELANPDYRISRRIVVTIRANETLRKSLDFGD